MNTKLRPRASDISDELMLRVVERFCVTKEYWSNTWEIAEEFTGFPEKVVHAKLSRLMHRGLLTGCDCGCRGDWELTTKGRAVVGITVAWRENPMERDYSAHFRGSGGGTGGD